METPESTTVEGVATRPVPEAPGRVHSSRLRDLVTRIEETDLAIKLAGVYEFKARPVNGGSEGVEMVLSNKDPLIPHSWTRGSLHSAPLLRDYNLAVNADRSTVSLPLGVTAVIGQSDSGKTRLTLGQLFMTAMLEGGTNPLFINFIESIDEDFINQYVKIGGPNFMYPRLEFELASILANALSDPSRELIVLDSMRYLFYSNAAGGSLGKGGVNNQLFLDLTQLDDVARQHGKRLVVLINPASEDPEDITRYLSTAKGGPAATIICRPGAKPEIACRFSKQRQFTPIDAPRSTVLDKPIATSSRSRTTETLRTTTRQSDASISSAVFGRK